MSMVLHTGDDVLLLKTILPDIGYFCKRFFDKLPDVG